MSSSSTKFYRQAPPDRGASSFIYPPTERNLAFFSRALNAGCLVAIPTETVYGLAGLALDPVFCRSIFNIKGRPLVDPLIVHVSSLEMARLVAELPPEAELLARHYWPGPLTLILRKKPIVPDIVTAGMPTVAVRMPRHPVAQELLKVLNAPLAAPSANPFGYVSPSCAEHVRDSFADKVPFIIDGGPCAIGIESTIVDLVDPDRPAIRRPGAISRQELDEILDRPVEMKSHDVQETGVIRSPGTFPSHYSPGTPLQLFKQGTTPELIDDSAILYLQRPGSESRTQGVYWLSEQGDPQDISRSLFQLLRKLDHAPYSMIQCELPAAESPGILPAVRDRLKRAAAK